MINSKINRFIKISLYIVLIFMFSCDDQDTIVISPPNSNTFEAKSFLIDSENSFSFKFDSYNAGDKPLGYAGSVDEVTNSKFLVKIDKNLIAENSLCDNSNDETIFNSLELRLWLKSPITSEPNSNVTAVDVGSNSNYNLNDESLGNFDCDDSIGEEICESTGGESIFNWIYAQDLNQSDCEELNPNGWLGDVDNCGPLGEVNQCCKYEGYIACCSGNNINDDQLINIYAVDPSFLNAYNEFDDPINHDESTEWNNHVEYALSSYFIDPFRLSINLYDYLINKYDISDNQEIDICNLQEDISILLETGEYFHDIYGAEYLDFFTTDDTNPSYFYYKPHIVINHSTETTEQIKIPKYTIDNNMIDLNPNISSNFNYTITNSDTINILSFSGINEIDNCSDPLDDTDCINNLNSIIDSGFNDELFNFDITVENDYLDKLAELDTLNDIIKLKFKGVQFLIEDLDPLNDDFHIDNNPEGTEGNLTYDLVEDFDDFGIDFCPDEYEDGQGGCLCDYYIENECINLNQDLIIYNPDGFEGDGIHNDTEYFDPTLDTGADGCLNQYEDGEGDCIALEDTAVYDPVTNPDPNGDDFSLDPGNDNWNDCGADGDCSIIDIDETQENGLYDFGEGT